MLTAAAACALVRTALGRCRRAAGAAHAPSKPRAARAGWATLSALTALVLLPACASLAPPATGSPEAADAGTTAAMLSGRIAVSVAGQPERSFSTDFWLRGDAQAGVLELGGPLGTTAARASWSAQVAELRTAQGETVRAASPDALAERVFGEPLPLAAMPDWLRGRAWPGAAAQPRADGLPGFEQLGWQLDLSQLAQGRIDARRLLPPGLSVRVRLHTD